MVQKSASDELIKKAGGAARLVIMFIAMWKLSMLIAKILFCAFAFATATVMKLIDKKKEIMGEYGKLTKDLNENIIVKILAIICLPLGFFAFFGIIYGIIFLMIAIFF